MTKILKKNKIKKKVDSNKLTVNIDIPNITNE